MLVDGGRGADAGHVYGVDSGGVWCGGTGRASGESY